MGRPLTPVAVTDAEYTVPVASAADGVKVAVCVLSSYDDEPLIGPTRLDTLNVSDEGMIDEVNVALGCTDVATPVAPAVGEVDVTDGGTGATPPPVVKIGSTQ